MTNLREDKLCIHSNIIVMMVTMTNQSKTGQVGQDSSALLINIHEQ